MQIISILLTDKPCNWHIQRKTYEQGWEFSFKENAIADETANEETNA